MILHGFHQWSIMTSAYNNAPRNLPNTGLGLEIVVLIGILTIVAGLFIHALRGIDE